MPDLTTKDALLERMVAATDNLATNISAKLAKVPDLSEFADYANFTAPTVYSSRLTRLAGGYKKVGNIVYVFYAFKIATSLNAGAWTFATGLPQPFTKGATVLDRVPLMCSGWIGDTESGRVVSANVSKDGQLALILGGSVSVTSDDTHGVTVYGFYYAG